MARVATCAVRRMVLGFGALGDGDNNGSLSGRFRENHVSSFDVQFCGVELGQTVVSVSVQLMMLLAVGCLPVEGC